jgi:hypothetical protein
MRTIQQVNEIRMQQQNTPSNSLSTEETYTFIREEGRWYIFLVHYMKHGWSKHDLELTAGAHIVLNSLSNGSSKVRLRLSLEHFDGANVLQLVEHCEAPRGGGIYLFNPHNQHNSSLFWICDLALFVFGNIPEHIYVKRLPLKGKTDLPKADTKQSILRNPVKQLTYNGQ